MLSPQPCPRTAEQCLPVSRVGATRERAKARGSEPRALCALARSHPRKPGPLLLASARPSPEWRREVPATIVLAHTCAEPDNGQGPEPGAGEEHGAARAQVARDRVR